MIGEQERQEGPHVPVTFLGRTLKGYPTLSRLARWYNVPIAVITCRREARPFSFAVQLHELILPPAADAPDPPLIQRIMGRLEQAILRHPEQYLWPLAGGTETTADVSRLSMEAAGLIGTGSESASFPTTRQRGSDWQTPSWADKAPADSAAEVALVPTA
jgi:hypothetical protein